MAVKELEKGRYQIDFRDQKNRRVREVVCGTKTEAKGVLSDRKRAVYRAKQGHPDGYVNPRHVEEVAGPTFREFAKRFMKDYGSSKRSDYYQQAVKVLTAFFDDRRLREVTRADIHRFAAERGKTVGPSTVRKNLTALGTMFGLAIEWGLVEIDPTSRLKKPAESQHKILYLGEEEFLRILEAAPPWLRPMLRMAVAQGLRLKEVTGLRWQDVDRGNARVYVNPDNKTGRPDAIRLTAEGRKILEELDRRRRDLGRELGIVIPWVFVDDAGRDYNDETDRNRISKLTIGCMRAAGRKGCSFHTLRHTTASWLVQRGVDLAKVREFMRHRNIQTTLRYAHLRPEHMDDVVEAMDAAFSDGHNMDTRPGGPPLKPANLLKRKERL